MRDFPLPLTKEQQLLRIEQKRISVEMREYRRRRLDENKVEELAFPLPDDTADRSDHRVPARTPPVDRVDVLTRALAIVLKDDCNSTKLRDWLEVAIEWDLCPTWQELQL